MHSCRRICLFVLSNLSITCVCITGVFNTYMRVCQGIGSGVLFSLFMVCAYRWLFFFGDSIKPENPYVASVLSPNLGSKFNPWEYIHSGRVVLPAVLPKVHHQPDPLYVPTEVNTLQVDGLARIPGLHKPHTCDLFNLNCFYYWKQ